MHIFLLVFYIIKIYSLNRLELNSSQHERHPKKFHLNVNRKILFLHTFPKLLNNHPNNLSDIYLK